MCRKVWLLLWGCLSIAATWGCGEEDILAIDRRKAAATLYSDAASDQVTVSDASDGASFEPPSGFYLEAESGQLFGGFTVGHDVSASGGQFIAPPVGSSAGQPGQARALYELTIDKPGTYIIWGRIQSPDTGHNRFWVQVDGGTWYFWYITTGEVWYWNRIHNNQSYYTPLTFDLAVGTHTLLFANAIDGIRLDRLYITPSPRDIPVGNDTPCNPPNSIQVDGGCIPSCGSLMGNQCGIPQCSGQRIVPVPVYDCQVCCVVPVP